MFLLRWRAVAAVVPMRQRRRRRAPRSQDLFYSGRGSKPHPPLKVGKASVQGLKANMEHFSKLESESCHDPRFGPLYRDAEGNMIPLEVAGSCDVESQPVSFLWRKAEGLAAGHGPQGAAQRLVPALPLAPDLDTEQVGGV
eukprot:Skav202561  [mRNA]  locus=scaffold2177:147464:153634:- [translate_table: standard]